MRDIETEEDIKVLVDRFYDKVKKDDLIGYIFTDVVHVNWEKHLPVMYRFWQNVLFYTGGYEGNPIIMHKHLNSKVPLNESHFNRWIRLFNLTVDENFEGKKATLAKQRALSISTVMQLKLFPQTPQFNE